ncbi:unnamed protein product [Ostreobium quekettii]|uniref:Uncharacterized protein n=1 Tax=Ostreobium quekettii TaxID=121088 RepID=A0A8S1J0W3_9CHLO|nr:unnamed protein product [Ostreobium quekettii]
MTSQARIEGRLAPTAVYLARLLVEICIQELYGVSLLVALMYLSDCAQTFSSAVLSYCRKFTSSVILLPTARILDRSEIGRQQQAHTSGIELQACKCLGACKPNARVTRQCVMHCQCSESHCAQQHLADSKALSFVAQRQKLIKHAHCGAQGIENKQLAIGVL